MYSNKKIRGDKSTNARALLAKPFPLKSIKIHNQGRHHPICLVYLECYRQALINMYFRQEITSCSWFKS